MRSSFSAPAVGVRLVAQSVVLALRLPATFSGDYIVDEPRWRVNMSPG
jgi:hypothetical protein